MDINHAHVHVRGVSAAVDHCRRIWDAPPTFIGPAMAGVPFGPVLVVSDRSDTDTEVTLGLGSLDCDGDFDRAVSRGAVVVEEPADRSWGVRVAYLRGPGAVTFEIEQTLAAT
jgi:hypothetical protein